MEERKKLVPYEKPCVEITRFEAGDCISTSDMNFGGDEGWGENLPGGGWT